MLKPALTIAVSFLHVLSHTFSPAGNEVVRFEGYLRIEENRATQRIQTQFFRKSKKLSDALIINSEEALPVPGINLVLQHGKNEGMPYDGILRFEGPNGDHSKYRFSQQISNWWTKKGTGTKRPDNTWIIKSELRQKDGRLVYAYIEEAKPCSQEEAAPYVRLSRLAQNYRGPLPKDYREFRNFANPYGHSR